MRIAVIGSGISGMASAWLLSRSHEVVMFEANDYVGGHTHTHDIELAGKPYRVDTGFIVMNPEHYPLFTRLLDTLGVATQPTRMSFSVSDPDSGFEYNAENLRGLFARKRNLVSPDFWRMLCDILRFYREAPAVLSTPDDTRTLAEYLDAGGYSPAFRDLHIHPMACALWSSPGAQIGAFPIRHLVQFMQNHQMMQASGRPTWRVVSGGSDSYVSKLRSRLRAEIRLATPVRSVRREPHAVQITHTGIEERFDQVVFACHSDQALNLLADASPAEREILGAIAYQPNEVVLHTDARLLPRRRAAWAAWNARTGQRSHAQCTVSYCMNILQNLDAPEPLVVSLNSREEIDPARVLRRLQYAHPLYSQASVAAQARRHEINGVNRSWYAGAYWGWGFHEDGMRSAVDIAQALGETF